MNKVDIIIFTIYIFFIIYGYVRGLIQSVLTFIVLVGVSLFIFHLKLPEEVYIYKNIAINSLIIKIFLFFLLTLFGMYLGNILTGKLITFNIIGFVDKLLGSLFGIILATFIVYGLNYIIMFFFTSTATSQSKIFPYIETILSKLIHYVK
jgi:membrane protein required for colicin V production